MRRTNLKEMHKEIDEAQLREEIRKITLAQHDSKDDDSLSSVGEDRTVVVPRNTAQGGNVAMMQPHKRSIFSAKEKKAVSGDGIGITFTVGTITVIREGGKMIGSIPLGDVCLSTSRHLLFVEPKMVEPSDQLMSMDGQPISQKRIFKGQIGEMGQSEKRSMCVIT